jgi:predicted transcriptional regulator of viral defense system
MNKLRELQKLTSEAVKNGHHGLFTTHDLALMLQVIPDTSFRKYLYTSVKTGVLRKVATNIYFNPESNISHKYVLEKIAKILHWDKFIYVSLESQLSYLGIISQIPMKRLTIMTTGRKREFETCFGVIEFTHTARSITSLLDDVYFDSDAGIFRAYQARAIQDLKRVGRNVGMLEE